MTTFHKEDAKAICRILLKHENWVESSRGSDVQKVWKALWKLKFPNKIKVFGWKVCHGILPTQVNLVKRKITGDNAYPICTQFPKTEIHALWDCLVAQDVWAGSRIKLQKYPLGPQDMLQIFDYLMDRLDLENVELFLVHAWIIWNQRNSVLYGGMLKDPGWLNKHAAEYLEEFKQA